MKDNKDTIQLLLEKLVIESDKKSELIEDIVKVCNDQHKMIENNMTQIKLLSTIVNANELTLNNAEKDFKNSVKLIDNLQEQIDILAGDLKDEL